MQERQHRLAAGPDPLQRAANAEIAACGDEPFFEHRDSILRSAALLVDLGEIQIKLSVVVAHLERFLAERLSIGKAPLSNRGEQAGVRKVERILGGNSESAPGRQKGFTWLSVAQELQTFFKVGHAGICWGGGSDPVGHRLLPRPASPIRKQGDYEKLAPAYAARNRTEGQISFQNFRLYGVTGEKMSTSRQSDVLVDQIGGKN